MFMYCPRMHIFIRYSVISWLLMLSIILIKVVGYFFYSAIDSFWILPPWGVMGNPLHFLKPFCQPLNLFTSFFSVFSYNILALLWLLPFINRFIYPLYYLLSSSGVPLNYHFLSDIADGHRLFLDVATSLISLRIW